MCSLILRTAGSRDISRLQEIDKAACSRYRLAGRLFTTAAVFGAIEFYTQWFERLGAEPWAIIVAGLTVVAFAIALWRYNLAEAAFTQTEPI